MSDQKRGKGESKRYLTFLHSHTLYLVSFLYLVLMTILSSFMFPKPIYQRTMHVASQNYDVINLIYKVIGVTWHHL